jgi:hypothetical protein
MPAAHACTAGSTAELAACITGNDAVIDLTGSMTLGAHLPVVEGGVTISLYGEVGKLWASGGDTRVKSQLNASAGLRVRW